ncbi:hypothetical protein T02_6827 [Trichinella nativa]|uniref:Uncharacterized protein n=1 Tax=Trichinella nativa TaxID=6335 RepID=A0A0V1KQK7_9BILA|nr:hypothetical protein T02_10731 [Trichinella nativa]KRZ54227.1 hypothetical protein T02_6827 [Trichinella nativa]
MHRIHLIIILIAKSPIEGYNVADQSEKSKDPNNSSYFQLTVAVRSKCASQPSRYHQRHLYLKGALLYVVRGWKHTALCLEN